jgi:Zn-dependent protease
LVAASFLIAGLALAGKSIPLGGILGRWLNDFGSGLYIPVGPELVVYFVAAFLYVSVYWALVNLLPIYPLDGGQISRELFVLSNTRDALRNSLILSIAAAGMMAIYGFSQEDYYLAILFGLLAYDSFTALQQHSGYGGYGRGW